MLCLLEPLKWQCHPNGFAGCCHHNCLQGPPESQFSSRVTALCSSAIPSILGWRWEDGIHLGQNWSGGPTLWNHSASWPLHSGPLMRVVTLIIPESSLGVIRGSSLVLKNSTCLSLWFITIVISLSNTLHSSLQWLQLYIHWAILSCSLTQWCSISFILGLVCLFVSTE